MRALLDSAPPPPIGLPHNRTLSGGLRVVKMPSIVEAFRAILAVAALVSVPAAVQAEEPDSSKSRAIRECDRLAAHALDPLKPSDIRGFADDADVTSDAAFVACHRALAADQTNPRVLFNWGRVNYARNPRLPGQPRQMFTMAYERGSEIAGVYLAKLPPEKSLAQLIDENQHKIEAMKGRRGSRPMTGQERDDLLKSSIFVIGSVALLRLLSGEAKWPSGECSGGYAINAVTHEVLCNGLVVGSY